MRIARWGDRVRVHYVIRAQDSSFASSKRRSPLELTVGGDHPRLPGLGSALVGLRPGEATTVVVPPERGHGLHDPGRVRRISPRRLTDQGVLRTGDRVSLLDKRGRCRLVRVIEVSPKAVLIDANRRWAGQTLELVVELVAIQTPEVDTNSSSDASPYPASPRRRWGEPAIRRAAFAFDHDATLASRFLWDSGEDIWRDEGGEG